MSNASIPMSESIRLDAERRTIGYEDVWTKIERCRRHCVAVGLGADHVEQFVR